MVPKQPEDGPDSTAKPEPGWATLAGGQRVELATPSARLGARAIDAVVLFGAINIVGSLYVMNSEPSYRGLIRLVTGFLFLVVVYEISMIAALARLWATSLSKSKWSSPTPANASGSQSRLLACWCHGCRSYSFQSPGSH